MTKAEQSFIKVTLELADLSQQTALPVFITNLNVYVCVWRGGGGDEM